VCKALDSIPSTVNKERKKKEREEEEKGEVNTSPQINLGEIQVIKRSRK
jgi:glutaredoxin